MLASMWPAMEHQVNIIFVLVFCFSVVEPIPFPEEGGRYGAQQSFNWPKNSNPPRQHQNHPRSQHFHPNVKNTSNRNYNQDYRPYERNYDNRYNTVPQGTGEKRPFYEGPSGRSNRPYYQPVPSIAGGQNLKERPPIDDGPPPYRPARHYDNEERSNEKYSPQVDRNYQQPINRPYNAPRIPLQRSVSENPVHRYRDFPQPHRSGYVDKQITPQDRSNTPVDFKYPVSKRTLDPNPQRLKSSLNTPHPRHEINKVLSDPEIQHYLETNHKRYLILHSNGTVEHVDSLDSVVQNYPNYVMVKAGDIIRNPKNNSLELLPPIPRKEILSPKVPEVMQRIGDKQNDLPIYGYSNSGVPYVTEKAYAQPISSPVSSPQENKELSNDAELAITTMAESIDALSNFVETTTEFYASTPSEKAATEDSNLKSLFENTENATSDTATEYTTSTPLLEITTQYVTFPYSSTEEPAVTSIPINIENEDRTFTEIDIVSENPISDANFSVPTDDYLNLASTINYPSEIYFDNIMLNDENISSEEDKKEDLAHKLRDFYSSAFGKLIQHLLPNLPVKPNNIRNNESGSQFPNEESITDPFNVTDIIDAITEIKEANFTTEKRAENIYDIDDFSTDYPFIDDLSYTTVSSLSDQNQTRYPDTVSTLSENNEEAMNPDNFNPFRIADDGRMSSSLNQESKENQYNSTPKDDNNYTLFSYITTESVNPFITFDDVNTEPSFEEKTEPLLYDTSYPVLANDKENITNPFVASMIAPKQRRRMRNKKILKSTTENYAESSTNPFTTIPDNTYTMVLDEEVPEFFWDFVVESENEGTLNPFLETNPFNEDVEEPLITIEDNALNPFIENYTDEIILSATDIPVTEDTQLFFDQSENVPTTNIVPYAYLPTEKSKQEVTTTPISDYDIKTVTDDFNQFSTTTEEVVVLTTTEKPTVWFKTDAKFWEKLINGTIPYEVVYLFQSHSQPIVEKDTKTTIFPNGTIVQEHIETVWEREGDTAPILVKSTKTFYPEEEP